MKLGLMTLGDMMDDPITGTKFSAAGRYRMMIDAAALIDRGGFYSINLGEHHGIDYTFSAPPVVLAAIAEHTKRLKLSTAVTLSANLDPLRVAEDYATVDVISGGRAEIVAGRGTVFETTYQLFGQPLEDSAARFAESIRLLCLLWKGEPVRWSGRFRPPINGESLRPKPIQEKPPIWIGGGTSRETAELAGQLGLKLMLPSAFGKPDKFIAIADIYREAFAKAGHAHKPEVGASWHGWVAPTEELAHARFKPRYAAYFKFTEQLVRKVSPNLPAHLSFAFDYDMLTTEGPAIVGSPSHMVDRIGVLAEMLDADLHIIKMDMGGVPAGEFLDMLQLMVSDVVPKL